MEPKDLKNSEELMRTSSTDAELKNVLQHENVAKVTFESDKLNVIDLEELNFDHMAEAEMDPEIGYNEVPEFPDPLDESAIGESENEPAENPEPEETEVGIEESVQPLEELVTEIKEVELSEINAPEQTEVVKAVEESSLAHEPVEEVVAEVKEIELSEIVTPEVTSTEVVTEEVAATEQAPEEVVAEVKETGLSEIVTPEVTSTDVVTEEVAAKAQPSDDVVADGAIEDDDHLKIDNFKDEFVNSDESELLQAATITGTDYSNYSQIDLVNSLRAFVEGDISEQSRLEIDAIKAAFYLKVKHFIDVQKKKFTDAGGVEEEFVPEEDTYETEVKELLRKDKQQRFELSRKLDAEKEINLRKKYDIIDEIKNLLKNEESINRTFGEFRDLQRKWYEIGQVPQAKMKDLWDTYHFHVENFYDYIKINKELRDLDLKKNLEAKISICEKAEELLMEPSVIKAFNTLQKFHEQWREIGPVPRDKKDDIWERFKGATSKINQKHQDYFEKRKLEQKKNYDAKIALCEKAEEICAMNLESHRDWDEKSHDLVELQKVWRTVGFAPKRENNKIYDRFRDACDAFFNKKREYYSKNKELQQSNMQMKIDLCVEAETLKESADWKKATQQFIDIQKRWKEIGPVPRKHSDMLWKRFRAACDFFFEKKSGHFNDVDDVQIENLKLKQQLIAEVESFKPDNDVAKSLKVLREFQRRWTEIGHVPIREKEAVQNRFRETINKHFDLLKVDDSNRNVFQFRSKIASMTDNNRGLSKVRLEREKYMLKLKQLESDLTLLDNNIGFFANSKNAQSLIADVNQKIVDTREKIEMLKDKIRIIDELDKSEY